MVARDDEEGAGSDCVQCRGSLETQDVLEHEPCGGVWPRPELSGDGGLRCPDCDDSSDDTFRWMGTIDYCEACDERFGHASASGDGTEPRSDTSTEQGTPWPWAGDEPSTNAVVRKLGSALTVLGLLAAGIGGAVAVGPFLSDPPTETGDRVWQTYDSIVVFRNDDIQPYYRAETMRAVDRIFIEADVPVTQGVVPAIGTTPLAEDGSLCTYLRELERDHQDIFEFALHGYTHEELTDFHDGSEFGGLSYERQYRRISHGQEILTDCLGHPATTFIPPLDTYDDQTVRALRELNFTLVSGGGWFTEEYYNETGVFTRGDVRHIPNSKSFVEDWTTNEFFSEEALNRSFDRAHENGSIYVQMLHYPQFNTTERRDRLRSLISHMKATDGVKFTTLGSLDQRFAEDTIRRTDDGWEVLEVPSSSERSETRYLDVLRDVREEALREWADHVDRGRRATVREREPDDPRGGSTSTLMFHDL